MKITSCPIRSISFSRIFSRAIGLLTLCASLPSVPVQAAIYAWNGAGSSGNWSDVGNWSFMITPPTNGDTLIFPGFQPRPVSTNDLPNLTLNQIRFLGSNYVIYGNSFTITNSIVMTNTVGTDTISLPSGMTLTTADITMLVSNSATLVINSVMSGNVGVIKNGSGTLFYDGTENTYTGTTTVNGGTLLLECGAFNNAFDGPLVINSGATVQLVIDEELPIGPPITVNSGGTLNLNTLDDSIGTSLTLNGNGSVLNANPLNLSANATVTANPGVIFLNPTISGSLNVNSGICTFNVINAGSLVGSFQVPASVSGAAQIVKTGVGFMTLSGANSFTNELDVLNGTLSVANPLALGTTTGGTTVSNAATLWIAGVSVTNEPLTIASTGIGIENASGANVWSSTSAINLVAPTTFEIDGVSLDFQCLITGAGGFTKTGAGTMTLSGTGENTYTGATVVNTGTLQLNQTGGHSISDSSSLTIGDGIGGAGADVVRYINANGNQIFIDIPITINSSGLLDLNGHTDDAGPVFMDGGQITTGAGTLELNPSSLATFSSTNGSSSVSGNLALSSSPATLAVSNALYIYAAISVNGFTKTGPGSLLLYGANTYTGPTLLQQGYLVAVNNLALGTTNNGTVVSSGATLELAGSIGITNESLTLNGPGTSPEWGSLDVESGINIWAGPITNNANSTLDSWGPGSELHINGPISGAGGLELFNQGVGGGTEFFEGPTANTYAGLTTIDPGGVLILGKSGLVVAVPGNLVISSSATARLASSQQTTDSADVFVDSSGLFDFSTFYTYLDTLRGSGTVNFGVNGWIYVGLNNGSSEFDGTFTGTGYSPGWTVGKTGSGTFTIGGNSTYTAGITHVVGGKLVINGSQPKIPVTVDIGSTLGGSGSVSTILGNGTISPGDSPGILTSSNVTFSSSGNFTVELTGPNPGVGGYDQLNVFGTVSLGNAALAVSPLFTTPVAIGQKFTIINNDLADAVAGTFNSLPEGSTISVGSYQFTISYVGGTGNDVVLTLTNVPGAAIASAVTSGDGNHAIDPNDCNSLNLVITNKTGSTMSGISATLSASTPGVIITQPNTIYPDIPGTGTGTNQVPFQISTLPDFVCGTPITLQLGVISSVGAFTVNYVLNSGETAAPVRFDNNTTTNVPDVGAIDSTNNVASWSGGSIVKVAVSLWLGAPLDSDLAISLIAPDGTTVPLSTGNGAGANFGTGSADANRTTFDDAAATSITAGSSPFVGTFRPQSPLSAFIGTSPVGPWHLHINDSGFYGSPDTLRNWSLFLYGTTCSSGSGQCELCPNMSFTAAMGPSSPLQTDYVTPNGVPSGCGVAKACPGSTDGGPYPSENYTFQNGSSNACISVTLGNTNASFGMVVAAYSAAGYNPTNSDRCANYLGDAGFIAGAGSTNVSFSFNVSSNETFVINVVAGGYGPYSLTVTGCDCTPALDITALPGNQARLDWSSAAGGYQLAATPALNNPSWTDITNEPIVDDGRFNVTNSMNPTNRFYRLHKP